NVFITGHRFENNPANILVTLNGKPVPLIACTPQSLTITVPEGATSGKLAVTIAGETGVSIEVFSLTSIRSFYPSSGTSGTKVLIRGYQFDQLPANNIVTFGSLPALVESSSDT